MIVAMAVVTTMIMPPTLRWVMARVPLGEDETKRLEKEEAEELQALPKMERALVYVDESPNGRLAARLAGLFSARQQMLTTVLQQKIVRTRGAEETASGDHLAEAAQVTLDQAAPTPTTPMNVGQLVQAKGATADTDIEKELAKGYDIVFVGIDRPMSDTADQFEERLQRLVNGFDGPVAIAINGAGAAGPADVPLEILLPAAGTQDARLATEIAISLAHASKGEVTALHVFDPQADTALLRGRSRRLGLTVLVDVHRAGKRSGVPVKGLTATNLKPEAEIRRALRGSRFDLVVLGTSLRKGETKFLGPRTAALLRIMRTPALLIAR
jgi:nucleotide-binding universal stress UspA family protein